VAWGRAETEDEPDDVRRKGSKCSFNRSNSRESGAESSNLWSWAIFFECSNVRMRTWLSCIRHEGLT
jgi:hypothetical protein